MGSCKTCRFRKVKCDGILPGCSPCCQANVDCEYDTQAKGAKSGGNTLKKNDACLPCKGKKKKCNGAKPFCKRCKSIGKEQECSYKDSWRTKPIRKIEPAVQGSRDLTLVAAANKLPAPAPTTVGQSVMDLGSALEEQWPSMSAEASRSALVTASGSQWTNSAVAAPIDLGPVPAWEGQWSFCLPNMSFPSPDNSLTVPTSIIPNPIMRLADYGQPLKFAVSDVSLDDLNMSFRLLFLSHLTHFGIYLPHDKQQAILSGDTSYKLIHPFFIHFAHKVGCHLYQEHRQDPTLLRIQAMHMYLARNALGSMRSEDDPFTFAQAHHFMAVACLYNHGLGSGRMHHKKAVAAIKRHDIRFVPRMPPLGVACVRSVFGEEVHERAVFLAQVIYSEINNRFIGGEAEDSGLDLEKQFRYELPHAYPILFQISPTILRVRSILFVKDANYLISAYKQQGTPTTSWVSMCRLFLTSLKSHIDSLCTLITDFSLIEDAESCMSLRFSLVINYTILGELYRLLAAYPGNSRSATHEFMGRCHEALKGVVVVTQGLSVSEYSLLDPFLLVCWARAMTMIAAEITEHAWTPPGGEIYTPPTHSGDTGGASRDFSMQVMLQSRKTFQTKIQVANELDCSRKR